MEKIVGSRLKTIDQEFSSAWTMHEVQTHYKVKTTLGKWSVLVEEKAEKDRYNLTLLKDDQAHSHLDATIRIPNDTVS